MCAQMLVGDHNIGLNSLRRQETLEWYVMSVYAQRETIIISYGSNAALRPACEIHCRCCAFL